MNKQEKKNNHYNRREFLTIIGAGASTLAISSLPGYKLFAQKQRPNIIIILTDDQGYSDLGIYGAKDFSTPNIDKLAAEGIRFTDFYAASSVCSPSRASLLTGCYAQRVGIPDVLSPPGPAWTNGRTNIGLNTKETTIAKMLKPLGYATACIGKWHLGHKPEFLPTRHGFDEYFGLPYSNDMIPDDYPPLPLMEGENVVQYNPDQSQLTTWYTERSLKYIEKNKDKPFFIYLPHNMPHVPLHVSEKFRGKSKQGLYGDVMMEVDWSVGEIMKKLTELHLDNNTLIIFVSDNGPWLQYGNHGGSASPLRGGKMTAFEGGQRVPCIMRWPGTIPPGSVCHELAANIDFLPTIAAITGAEMPSVKIDGKNIQSLMKSSPDSKTPHKEFFYYFGNDLQAVRSDKWKLHLQHPYLITSEAGSNGVIGKSENKEQPLALYNLETDIEEKINLASEYPEIVQQFKKIAIEFDTDLKKNIRPAGKVDP